MKASKMGRARRFQGEGGEDAARVEQQSAWQKGTWGGKRGPWAVMSNGHLHRGRHGLRKNEAQAMRANEVVS